MDICELKSFVAVCELRNFTLAANKLYVSQPSITKTIQKMERELGLQLFDRNSKRVLLTKEGTVFFNAAKDIVTRLDSALDLMNEYKNLTKGSFLIAIPPMIGAYVFPPIFAAFKDKFPNLEMVVIEEEGSYAAANLVKREDVHVGLVTLPPNMTDFEFCSVTVQEVMVCLPIGHPLSDRQSLTFEELKNQPLILHNEGFALREMIEHEYSIRNLTPKVILSTNQFQTIKALVEKGTGISFLTSLSVEDAQNMVKIPLSPPVSLTIGLVWKPNILLPLACKALIDFVKDYSSTKN